MDIGYARTSTADQEAGFEAQLRDLRTVGVERVFQEKVSSVAKREQLEAALDFVRDGDTLVVTKLDRLARSTADLLKFVDHLQSKNVGLRILDFGGGEIDTSSPNGKLTLTMFATMAQFEREIMLERQREGIAKAKAEGRYKGRKPVPQIKVKQVCVLRKQGVKIADIAKKLSLGRSTVYRLLHEAR